MLNREPQGRVLPLLISLIVVGVLLMTFDVRSEGEGVVGAVRTGTQTLIAPLQEAAAFVVTPITDIVEDLSSITSLREENIALRKEVARLEAAQVAVQDQLARLEAFEQLYDMEAAGDDIGRTVANVVGGVDAFDAALRIDKGTADGIVVGQPVVDTNGFVVGTVKTVTRGSAVIVPITATRQGLTVMVDDQIGTLTSHAGSDVMRLEIPDARTPVLAGAKVRTAAISSRFPTGWPVGEVIEDAGPILDIVSTTVQLYVRPETLRLVVVLAWPPDPFSIITDDTVPVESTTSTEQTSTTVEGGGG